MLEVNCQYWIDNYDMSDFSNSIANNGNPDIGKETWANACTAISDGYKSRDVRAQIVTSTAIRKQVIAFFLDFGAWDSTELNSMSNIELSALVLQYIAGNYRETIVAPSSITQDSDNDFFYRYNDEIWIDLSD